MKPESQDEVLRRLRCIEGHVRGVAKMVETDSNCLSVIHQVKALQGALDKVVSLVIEEHLTSNWSIVLESMDQKQREDALFELGKILTEYQAFSRYSLIKEDDEQLTENLTIRSEMKE
ncbi:MAG: hypothetical protein A2Z14_01640 [Chloroflexi bacterium RBG_16_48_8]|nr:MAG: hypothetical protein A2Z14_01640 [Chloroflexi bacterium RBG_16_48_8]